MTPRAAAVVRTENAARHGIECHVLLRRTIVARIHLRYAAATSASTTATATATAAGTLALAGVIVGLQAAPSADSRVDLKRDAQSINRTQSEPSSYSPVVKRVAPSVVKITTSTKARRVAASPEFPGFDHPMLRQYFGGRMPEMQQPPQSGLGSGVIISADGYIATNNHVIQGADVVTVAFDDGR